MSYGDINSGATPQPGGVVYHPQGDDDAQSVQEQVAEATQDALKGEGAFANVEAGTADGGAITVPVVEADDQKAQYGETDSEEEDKAPAKSANKGEWVDYAVAQGADREEAEDMTKDELVEAYGD